MVHAEQLCDHVVMIHRGDKCSTTDRGDRAPYNPRNLSFERRPGCRCRGPRRASPVSNALRKRCAWDLTLAPGADAASVIQRAAAAIPPARVELAPAHLEDVLHRHRPRGIRRGRRRVAARGGAGSRGERRS